VKNKAVRATPKGRSVDPQARNDVQALLAAARRQSGVDPRRRDLLIENLHRIQDRFGRLSAAHLAALAEAMRLSQTEVYEVASFYHHFDVVKEGEPAPARVTVRVCESIACALAGADAVYTDVWTSMGQEREAVKRRRLFADYRVDTTLMQHARRDALFMHCLPAHRGEEVTGDVLESTCSVVFDQAENRLHTQKALLAMLLG